ncbi:MAG: Anti-sigma factor antagonist [Actinomycetia bacterium]|nr:Anti-sigma factor antagonist [Actinomycetes bacterium]
MTSTCEHSRPDRAEFARLEYTATGADGPHLQLALRGEIDMAAVPLLRDALDKVTTMPPCPVTVDLAAVTFLCSTGLNFIAAVNKHVTGHGHTVTITNPAVVARRALQVCGFDRVIAIVGTGQNT